MEHDKKYARKVLSGFLFLSMLTLTYSCKPESDSPITTDSGNDEVVTVVGDEESPPPTENTTEDDPVTTPVVDSDYVEQIQTLAASSSCASYSWAGRGKAPVAYIKGMALTYAKSFCRLKRAEVAPIALVNILSGSAGSSTTDALGLYSSTFSSLSMDINNPGSGPLTSLYTLGVGLGMRESSGKYCEGRDMSASNTSASTAEAGMFQTSYDSMSASAELSKLYAEYKADTSKCFLNVFKVGVSCSSSSISGSGEGATYQSLNKSCPAFAAEYAMVMLRVRRNHYGPINRKEAEVAPVCHQML